MRIALIGQAAFAEKALEAILAHGDQIVHVYAPPDSAAGRVDPLAKKARELSLPLSQPKSFKSEAAFEQFKSIDADLAILAFVTLIVPERILYHPRHRSICFHPSILPRHRGASAINWALMMGDNETGVTWFWPDKGIDTGPILLQKLVPVGIDDTVGSLYFPRLFPLGIETMIESIEMIRDGRAPAIAQDESRATYEPPCRDEHAKIDFARLGIEVHNLIRGCDPQPGAYADLKDTRIRLYEPRFDQALADSEPGKIISIDNEGMKVALRDASVVIRRMRLDTESKKVTPSEMADRGAIEPGMRLS